MAALRNVYKRNAFIGGEEVGTLEAEFAKRCGVFHGIGVSSGTAALTLSLRALDVGPKDEVITSPFSFYSSTSSIVAVGARPRFVDVDPETLNMDPCQLESARSRKTRGILPVHTFGQPADMEGIGSFARPSRACVINCRMRRAAFASVFAIFAVSRSRPAGSRARYQ